MGMQTDVLASKARTNDGQLVDQSDNNLGRVRVKSIYIVPTPSSEGSVVFKDGGSGGATKMTVNIPNNATGGTYLLMPGEGVLFSTNVYVDVTTIGSVMVFYG